MEGEGGVGRVPAWKSGSRKCVVVWRGTIAGRVAGGVAWSQGKGPSSMLRHQVAHR